MIKNTLSLSLTLLCFIITKPLVAAEPTIANIHLIDSKSVSEKRITIGIIPK